MPLTLWSTRISGYSLFHVLYVPCLILGKLKHTAMGQRLSCFPPSPHYRNWEFLITVDLLGELLLYAVAEKVLDVVFAKWPLALTEFGRSGTFHHFQRSTIASR